MTALMPPEQASLPQGPPRIPAIAVDLLPAEIVAGRRDRKIRRAVITGLVVVVVLLTGWYALARVGTYNARQDLNSTQADVQRLTDQQKTYDPLVQTQADTKTITGQLTKLMANDTQWSTLLGELQAAAPSGAALASASVTLTDAATGTTKGLPIPTGVRVIGTLTITGAAPSKRVVAAYMDALAKVKGLIDPLVNNVADDASGVQFVSQFDLTSAVLGGRYSPSPTPSTGSK